MIKDSIVVLHNRTAGDIVRSIVKPTLDLGGSPTDVLILLESVVVVAKLGSTELSSAGETGGGNHPNTAGDQCVSAEISAGENQPNTNKDGDPLESADAIIRDVKRKIVDHAIQFLGRGSLDADARRMLAWCGELNDAQDFLEEALRAERNKG